MRTVTGFCFTRDNKEGRESKKRNKTEIYNRKFGYSGKGNSMSWKDL